MLQVENAAAERGTQTNDFHCCCCHDNYHVVLYPSRWTFNSRDSVSSQSVWILSTGPAFSLRFEVMITSLKRDSWIHFIQKKKKKRNTKVVHGSTGCHGIMNIQTSAPNVTFITVQLFFFIKFLSRVFLHLCHKHSVNRSTVVSPSIRFVRNKNIQQPSPQNIHRLMFRAPSQP